jgi:hypothetical protein
MSRNAPTLGSVGASRIAANSLSHRYSMTRCFPYHSDKLSRLALPSGLIERRPSCGIKDLAERGYPAPILPRRLAYNLTYLVRAPGIRFDPAPSFSLRYTQKPVGKEKTRKKAIGFTGGGAGRRDSGVRRVDVYLGTYETVGRIEKPGSSPGFWVCGFLSRCSERMMNTTGEPRF